MGVVVRRASGLPAGCRAKGIDWMVRLGVLITALVMMLAPASAQARPGAAVVVSPLGVRVHAPTVAVAGNGRIAVAWATPGPSLDFGHAKIEARLARIGRRWNRTQTLSGNGGWPVSAIGRDGTAAVAWVSRGPGSRVSLGAPTIELSVAKEGHAFGRPMRIASGPGLTEPVYVQVGAGGQVVLVWSRELPLLPPVVGAVRREIEYARAAPGQSRIVDGRIGISNYEGPSVAQAGDGTALVTFTEVGGANRWIASLPAGTTSFAAAPLMIPTTSGHSFLDAAPFGGPGGAAVAFRVFGHPPPVIAYVAGRGSNGFFEQPVAVAEGPGEASEAQAVDRTIGRGIANEGLRLALPAGAAEVAAWQRSEELLGDQAGVPLWTHVMASVRAPGAATFGQPVRLSRGGGHLSQSQTAVAGGSAVVVWAQDDRPCTQRIYAAVRPSGGGFSAPAPLTRGYNPGQSECSFGDGQLAVAGSDRYAVAGWVENWSLHLATFKG